MHTSRDDKKKQRGFSQFCLLNRDLIEKPSIHYRGMPESRRRNRFELPNILLIRCLESGIYLERFTSDGRCVGDTWHESVEIAKEQAEFEYGAALEGWLLIPEDVESPVDYALSHSRSVE